MPRPLTKPHKLLVSMSGDDYQRLQSIAGLEPAGPVLVRLALHDRPAPPPEPKTAKAALEAWETRWMPHIRKAAPMMKPVQDAVATLLRVLP
jgi:hypothetical protein